MSILINDVAPRVHYTATQGQTVFVVPFEWIANTHLKVWVNEVPAIFDTPALDPMHYHTTGEGITGGGSITFGAPGRNAGDEVIIIRDMPIARTTDLPTSGVFPVAQLNDNFDAEAAMIQQTEVNVQQRTIGLELNDFVHPLNRLPNRHGRAGKYLAFDHEGQPLLLGPGTGTGADGILMLVWTGDDPPPEPWRDGQMWWESDTSNLYVYYDDGDSQQWVQINFLTSTGPITVPEDLEDLQALDPTAGTTEVYLANDTSYGHFSWDASNLSPILARHTATTTAVNDVTDTCTRTLHGLWTGSAFVVNSPANGLVPGTIYWSTRVDDNNFKISSSFDNVYDSVYINLVGTVNFTYRRLVDPLQGVYVIPDGYPIDGSGGAWVRQREGPDVQARWFGYEARANAARDDGPALQAAINFAGEVFQGGAGANVLLGTGIAYIGQIIFLPNRVAILGVNSRSTVLKPHASFTGQYFMLNINTGLLGEASTSSTFGSRILDCYLDVRGFNMIAVIQANAWQETCGLQRVLIQFNGTTQFGLLLSNGFGGASYLRVVDTEIFTDTSNASAAGIRMNELSSVGGSMLHVDSCSIVGSLAHPLPNAILIDNDSALIRGLHVEYVLNAISMHGVGSLSADTITGSFNGVTNLVTIGSGFTGKLNLRNLIPNGATGNTVNNGVSGEHILASEGMIAQHTWPLSGFFARMAADQAGITGNGTSAFVLFDTEVFDRRAEYNPATGVFTAKRTGKYDFSAYLKLGPSGVGTTNCTMVLAVSSPSRVIELFRGDQEAIRDSSSNVTIGGGITSVPVDAGATVRIQVTVSGLGGNTVGVLAGASYFSGSFIER